MVRCAAWRVPARLGAAVIVPMLALSGVAQAGDAVFKGLSGSWSGTGTVSVSNGSSESIRCRATYSVTPSGEQLHQELRCASDSYKFEVNSNVISDGSGDVSGTWTEKTRQVTGAVTGKVSPGLINTSVQGTGFTAQLSVQTKGDRQAVTIRPTGTEITNITIEMRRG